MQAAKNIISNKNILIEETTIYSEYLEREVRFDAYLPTAGINPEQMSLLLINDGQDLPTMRFDNILESLYEQKEIEPIFCIGIYCGAERKREYGTISFCS